MWRLPSSVALLNNGECWSDCSDDSELFSTQAAGFSVKSFSGSGDAGFGTGESAPDTVELSSFWMVSSDV